MDLRFAAFGLLLLASCSSPPPPALVSHDALTTPADVLLLGEQHDAAEHQETHRQVVQAFVATGGLAALVLEMAEQGGTTTGLPPGADETSVQAALHWKETAWPWPAYGPAVMTAVRAGVPVIGANLTRPDMRTAMADDSLDGLLPGPALKAQQQAIRIGHCNQLPESQIRPMTRVQIARDRAIAATISGAAVPGKTVVLLAGAGHVDPTVGVPRYLGPDLYYRSVKLVPQPSAKDYCAQLKRQRAR